MYERRKETSERNFADLKEKHGLRWTNYRGLERNQMQAMLVCAAMNLKKLANYLWRKGLSFLYVFEYASILVRSSRKTISKMEQNGYKTVVL